VTTPQGLERGGCPWHRSQPLEGLNGLLSLLEIVDHTNDIMKLVDAYAPVQADRAQGTVHTYVPG
jgi:hypothetical protein